MIYKIISLFLLVLLYSVTSTAGKIDKEFRIRQGWHFSTFRINHVKTTEMAMEFKFDESAKYTSRKPENQADINKLWGFSDCNRWEPQKDSARFGWRWFNDRIEILAFVDHKFIHRWELLGTTKFGEWSSGMIKLEGTNYAFYYKGKKVLMERHCHKNKFTGYRQFPYFGGDEEAPHEVRIHLRDL